MTAEPLHQPTDAQIDAVLAKYTPRQVAIAYLRASRKARDAGTAFSIMDGIAGAAIGLARGNAYEMNGGLKRSLRAARAHKEASE